MRDTKKIIVTKDIIKATVEALPAEEKPSYIAPANKKGGSRTLGILTKRMAAVMDWKASDVEMMCKYCERHGLDPDVATVADCLIHNQLFWVLNGSAPHSAQLFDRLEGKTVENKNEKRKSGNKMSITEAVGAFINNEEDDDD